MLDRMLPIKTALGEVKPSEFYSFLQKDEKLREEYNSVKQTLKDIITMEMISVYHTEKGQWASQNIQRKIKSLETILHTLQVEDISTKVEVEITYTDEKD